MNRKAQPNNMVPVGYWPCVPAMQPMVPAFTGYAVVGHPVATSNKAVAVKKATKKAVAKPSAKRPTITKAKNKVEKMQSVTVTKNKTQKIEISPNGHITISRGASVSTTAASGSRAKSSKTTVKKVKSAKK